MIATETVSVHVTRSGWGGWLVHLPGHFCADDTDVYEAASSLVKAKRCARYILPEECSHIRWEQMASGYWILNSQRPEE